MSRNSPSSPRMASPSPSYSAARGLFAGPTPTTQAYGAQSPGRVALSPRKVALTNEAGRLYPSSQALIDEQKKQERNRKARERRANERAAKGMGEGQRGRAPLPMQERVDRARATGKILDVSGLAMGRNAKSISTPTFLRTRFGVLHSNSQLAAIPIVSSDLASYELALTQFGIGGQELRRYTEAWAEMERAPKKGGGRARGAQKTPEEKKMQQRQYRLTSQARKKLLAGKALSAEEQNALRMSEENKARKQAGNPQTRALLGLGASPARTGVLSPRSRALLNV
jgi:hypothetical protein